MQVQVQVDTNIEIYRFPCLHRAYGWHCSCVVETVMPSFDVICPEPFVERSAGICFCMAKKPIVMMLPGNYDALLIFQLAQHVTNPSPLYKG